MSALLVCRRDRVMDGRACGPSGKGSGEEGILSGVVPVYLYCPAFNDSVSLGVYSRHACLQAAQLLSIPRTVAPSRAERCVQTNCTAAYQHAARHLLLSLTRQWLMTEHHLTQYLAEISLLARRGITLQLVSFWQGLLILMLS